MKNKVKKVLCGFMTSMLVLGLCSCGTTGNKQSSVSKEESKTSEASSSAASSSAATSSTAASSSAEEVEKEMYPIEGNVTLTYAFVDSPVVTANAKNTFETPFGKALQEATGVTIELIECANAEALKLLMAGDDLPDLIFFDWGQAYNGGAAKAIEDGIIEPLNDYLDEWAPDLKAVLDSNDSWRKVNTTSKGDIFCAPMIRGDAELCVFGGLIIRQDWLDELKLEMPQTPDDLYEVLKIFKEKKGAEIPFTTTNFRLNQGVADGAFASPFGYVRGDWYQVDGKVHYGRVEEGYKETLAFLNKLYTEGLLDPNYLTNEDNVCRSNVANGISGVAYGNSGAYIGNILTAVESAGGRNGFALTGFGPLVENAGDTPMGGQCDVPTWGTGLAMTPDCENKEAAVKFMNYAYTEAGYMLYNFGIEGVSYEMKDGYPTYTDLIMKNPNGWSMQEALAQYCRSWIGSSMVQDARYQQQYAATPDQKAALEQWGKTDMLQYQMPNLPVAEEDQAEYSKLIADIETYVAEMFIQYITGQKSIDTFESEYLAQLKKMKIDRVIEIRQAALDEYNAR